MRPGYSRSVRQPGRGRAGWARLLAALLTLAAGGYGYVKLAPLLGSGLRNGPQPVKLVKISDGDTLHLQPLGLGGSEEVKVRLIGIDSPELGSADGFRAATAISLLVEGASKLELEPELNGKGKVKHDKYGRVLGWVWVTPGPDWPRQREWLLRYPAGTEPLWGLRSVSSREAGPKPRGAASSPAGRLLLQEQLVALDCAELYKEASGSKYYGRLETAGH